MVETNYKLVKIGKHPKENGPLAEGLKIYSECVSPHDRTNDNEIAYWIDRYNDMFNDELECFAFYRNEKCVGFSQVVYFTKEKLSVVDYLLLENEYNKNNLFYEFFEQIRTHFASHERVVDYWIYEVFHSNADGTPSENDVLLISLLRLQGFKEVHSYYTLPSLGLDNSASCTNGRLMIFAEKGLGYITRNTFKEIVETIYFKHYLRWYEPFLREDYSIYKDKIQLNYETIISRISTEKIAINGSNIFKIMNPSPLQETPPKTAFFLLKSLICIGSISAIILAAKIYLGERASDLAIIVSLSFLLYFSIISFISKDTRRVFFHLIKQINIFHSK